MAGLMTAALIWDGGDEVRIPKSMGLPRADQMQGTAAERLTELAGRICYDSLGKGRPSFSLEPLPVEEGGQEKAERVEGYHEHIQKVGHGSVLEHFNFTVGFRTYDEKATLNVLANRPGVFIAPDTVNGDYRVTLNLRTLVDWKRIVPVVDWYKPQSAAILGEFQRIAHQLAPHIVPESSLKGDYFDRIELVDPVYEQECWVSLYMSGSRGFSHEQVRHGDFTAISQRSTRYVDESTSPWVEHPLIAKFVQENGDTVRKRFPDGTHAVELNAKASYKMVAWGLEEYLKDKKVDPTTARKQARGAARGILGNALQTEMVFSATVAQWKWMIEQRLSAAADAEIREVYVDVLEALIQSRYSSAFSEASMTRWGVKPSPDGIGFVLDKTGGVA